MKSKIAGILFMVFLSICCTVQCSAQLFRWVKGGGSTELMIGSDRDEGEGSICTDNNGNVYSISVMGNYAPILADTFSRPTGAYGATQNAFISSYACDGHMRWAKLIGSNSGECLPYAITADTSGHVYVAAYMTNSTSHVGYDTVITGSVYLRQCLIQYDTSGHLNWMRFLGPNTSATWYGALPDGSSLALDSSENIHFICSVRYGLQITPTVLSHLGTYDIKYDPSGNLLSALKLQLDSSLHVWKSIIDKKSDKLYSIGYRNSLFVPDSSPYRYIASFDVNRNLIWKDTVSDPSSPGYGAFDDIISLNGRLYLTGQGSGSAAYRGDTVWNTLLPGYNISFVLQADTAGNPIWMRGYSGTTGINLFLGITRLGSNKIAAAGLMAGKIKSGSDSVVIYSGEGQNPFFTILDTAGNIFTLQQVHGSGFYDAFRAVASDKIGSLYMQGNVETSVWAGSISPYASIGGNSDYCVMKYGANCGCTAAPVASFTAVGTHTVNFTYTGTAGSSALDSVRWYFGDGGTSTALNPSHVYTYAGTYHACIRVYSACGGDVKCQDIVITCPFAPVASFTLSGVYNKAFTYTGTTAGMDSIRWKFGDGGTSTLMNPTHSYTSPGTYTACVSIYTWCAWDSSCMTFTVPCVTAPVASFTFTGTPPSKTFTYTGTTAAMDSIRWYFGDGGTSTSVNPSHTYAAAGTYTVCVTIYNPCGSSTVCSIVTIPCVTAPVAAYSYSGVANTESFTFSGTTTGIDSVGWNFGDGWRTTGLGPTHTFTAIGTFNVCAKVYSACGNDTECHDIFVPCVTPTVTFTHTATAVDSTGHFTYTGTTASTDSVQWTFGDGTVSTGTTVNHHYGSTGIYTVCAIAFSTCGNDTLCDTIKIYSLASASIEGRLGSVTVLPNPVRNELTIEHAANCYFAIYNLLGQKMLGGHITDNRQIVNVAQLSNAIYLIQLTDPEGSKRSIRLFKE